MDFRQAMWMWGDQLGASYKSLGNRCWCPGLRAEHGLKSEHQDQNTVLAPSTC